MIERFGRRSLMLSGLWLQFLAYLMVAISVALLSHAPLQVRGVSDPFALDDHLTICIHGRYIVGSRRDHFPILLLCCFWLHMGNGTLGVPS